MNVGGTSGLNQSPTNQTQPAQTEDPAKKKSQFGK